MKLSLLKHLFPTLSFVLLALMIFDIELFSEFFGFFTKNAAPAIYSRDHYLNIVGWHLLTVLIAGVGATIIAVSVGIFVTRPVGIAFKPLAKMLANLGQTFPPIAVLALSVPLLGFGMEPILVALFLYGILPIFENTIAGLEQVPEPVLEAARGMGLTQNQRLISIELPLAMPFIVAGIRVSTVINIGTVAIGSTVAAKGLGEVIIAGLLTDNMAFVLQGGIMVALLAIVTDKVIEIFSLSKELG